MTINDENSARFYLGHISYYRLKGYWWDMQKDNTTHQFDEGSCFNDVINRYSFDKELRLILFDAVETIEIALRTKLIYHLSQSYGGLWYLNDKLFTKKSFHTNHIDHILGEFDRSKEVFVKEYKNRNWKTTAHPDSWIILETVTMGTLSVFYKNLKHTLPEASAIAHEFGLNSHSDLSSWLESIAYMRNIIAHHSRIFSRNMVKKPVMPNNPRGQWLVNGIIPVQEKKAFIIITTMVYLCSFINPKNPVKLNLLDLFEKNKGIIYKLGFLNNWDKEPIWRVSFIKKVYIKLLNVLYSRG